MAWELCGSQSLSASEKLEQGAVPQATKSVPQLVKSREDRGDNRQVWGDKKDWDISQQVCVLHEGSLDSTL